MLRGDEKAVLHLHGYWDEPESVVLGIRSYEAVLGDAAAVTLEDTLPSGTTFVSVADPSAAACSESSGVVTCGLGEVKAGDVQPLPSQLEPQLSGPAPVR